MKYYRVLFVALIAIAGCSETKKEGNEEPPLTLQDVGRGVEKLIVTDRTQTDDIRHIKNSLKGKEFRGLQMGIPIGNGVLRISLPTDDEGNQVISPSQLRDAWLQESELLKRDPPPAPAFDSVPPAPKQTGKRRPTAT